MRCFDLQFVSNNPNNEKPGMLRGYRPPTHRLEREKTNIPEISPQINNLPRAQSHQHAHGPQRKPLDPLVRALIGVAQLLLAHAQVLHFLHDLIDAGLDAPQLRVDGLELLGGLDRRPIARVGADVDV
jgi:hypothetical protein